MSAKITDMGYPIKRYHGPALPDLIPIWHRALLYNECFRFHRRNNLPMHTSGKMLFLWCTYFSQV